MDFDRTAEYASHHGEEEGGKAEEEEGEETVSIGLEQWRFDFRGDIAIGGGFLDRELRLPFHILGQRNRHATARIGKPLGRRAPENGD